MNYLICYDISNNKKRRKVSKILESYGIRTQFSIFELEVNNFELDKIKEDLVNTIDQETDRIYIFTICKECHEKIFRSGNFEQQVVTVITDDVIFV